MARSKAHDCNAFRTPNEKECASKRTRRKGPRTLHVQCACTAYRNGQSDNCYVWAFSAQPPGLPTLDQTIFDRSCRRRQSTLFSRGSSSGGRVDQSWRCQPESVVGAAQRAQPGQAVYRPGQSRCDLAGAAYGRYGTRRAQPGCRAEPGQSAPCRIGSAFRKLVNGGGSAPFTARG